MSAWLMVNLTYSNQDQEPSVTQKLLQDGKRGTRGVQVVAFMHNFSLHLRRLFDVVREARVDGEQSAQHLLDWANRGETCRAVGDRKKNTPPPCLQYRISEMMTGKCVFGRLDQCFSVLNYFGKTLELLTSPGLSLSMSLSMGLSSTV